MKNSIAFLVFALACACGTAVPGGGGTSSGTTGTNTNTGTNTGSTSSQPVPNPNATVPAPSTSSAALASPLAFCAMLLDASCQFAASCKIAVSKVACFQSLAIQAAFSECAADEARVLAAIQKGTMKVDPAQVGACIQSAANSCSTEAMSACMAATGTRKVGDPCAFSDECPAGSACLDSGPVKGNCPNRVCKALPKAGEACTGTCAKGSYCKDGKICAALPGAGEACANSICKSGLNCVENKCYTRDQLSALCGAKANQACQVASTSCSTVTGADGKSTFTCKVSKWRMFVDKGDACDSTEGVKSSSGSGAARPPPGVDASSSSDTDAGAPKTEPQVTTDRRCKMGLRCDSTAKVCVDPPALSAACDPGDATSCAPYYVCGAESKQCEHTPGVGKPCAAGGLCAAPLTCEKATKTCIARKADGQPCTSGNDCQSDDCASDVCAAMCPIP
jgi:hypothetical protein